MECVGFGCEAPRKYPSIFAVRFAVEDGVLRLGRRANDFFTTLLGAPLVGRRRAQLEGVVLVCRTRARRVEELQVKVGVGVLVAGGALLAHRAAAQRVAWGEWVDRKKPYVQRVN